MSDKPISRFPVPDTAELPDDIRDRIIPYLRDLNPSPADTP